MADKRDYYEVLGLTKDASDNDIKKAYRRLAKENHPDLHPGDKAAETRFKESAEAYAVLSDPDKKSKYDQFGHAAFDPAMGGTGFDFGDIGDIFGDLFGGIFGGSGRRQNGPMQGEHIRAGIAISFEEAAFGCEKELSVVRTEDCPECGGSGSAPGTTAEICPDCKGSGVVRQQQRSPFGIVQTTVSCPKCRGTGKLIHQPCPGCRGAGSVRRQRKISANIPAGIDEGQSIVLRGLGSAGKNGGPQGDLLVTVSVRPHRFFKRDGFSVLYTLPISFVQAALGDEVALPTLDGQIRYTIPEGTQTGTVFRLNARGIPYIRGKGRGDQFVTIRVVTPENLGEAQKAILREFAKATGETPPAPNDGPLRKKRKK
ncbi:MAG: molecular chaperone DnaJ [Oscillospiraceae bacterium]|jgi:molecular chaperone DnaJ|nr:molecular chaperone DnaJ [Oscillospiraceae bacterium]